MFRLSTRAALAALAVTVVLAVADSRQAKADGPLFYNYYAPSSVGGPPAQMYICPRPVPPHVGHTYLTYQPLYPQEFLYPHMRVYRRYGSNGWKADNTTTVRWW